MHFYVTDHSADKTPSICNEDMLREVYRDMRENGMDEIRCDFRWNKIEPIRGHFDEGRLRRYARASQLMIQEGLRPPTIVLSSIPKWAMELYKKDKEEFFRAFGSYARRVHKALIASGCRIEYIQVLNEWNNPIYTPVATDDLPRLCAIVRETFNDNPKTKIMGTVIVSNLNNFLARFGFGKNIFDYLRRLRAINGNFDVIGIDYYPGLWHVPLKKAGWRFKNLFRQLDLLRSVCGELAAWGKEYEIAETGCPSGWPWSEKTQVRFYQEFFGEFKLMLEDLQKKNIRLPSRVGIYEAIDEPPGNLAEEIAGIAIPLGDMGLLWSDGSPKLILQSPPDDKKGGSYLKRIIKNVNGH